MPAILIKFRENVHVRERNGLIESESHDFSNFLALLAPLPIARWVRNFVGDLEVLQSRLARAIADRGIPIPNPALFYTLKLPEGVNVEPWITILREIPAIEYAVLSPRIRPFVTLDDVPLPPATLPPIPAVTPDLTSFQPYLGPEGIDAISAWSHLGGAGFGVNVCNCEEGFIVNHEDLPSIAVVSSLGGILSIGDRHGAKTLGVLFASDNGLGVTGICHEATPMFASSAGPEEFRAQCIHEAIRVLTRGDVIVVEMQSEDQLPAEFSPCVHAACSIATGNGIIVVAAAGNGEHDLDISADALRNRIWRSRGGPGDSGAIIVGAGETPPHPRARSCRPNSCFGARVDCQGWGENVATTGAGFAPFFDDPPLHREYTRNHFGTSSATAMIAGVVAALQGIHKHRFGRPIHPTEMRRLLADDDNGQRQPDPDRLAKPIGPLPSLKKLIRAIGIND